MLEKYNPQVHGGTREQGTAGSFGVMMFIFAGVLVLFMVMPMASSGFHAGFLGFLVPIIAISFVASLFIRMSARRRRCNAQIVENGFVTIANVTNTRAGVIVNGRQSWVVEYAFVDNRGANRQSSGRIYSEGRGWGGQTSGIGQTVMVAFNDEHSMILAMAPPQTDTPTTQGQEQDLLPPTGRISTTETTTDHDLQSQSTADWQAEVIRQWEESRAGGNTPQ
ncbi:MAG: hypothetical protein FWE31_02820 [Firmicutes bacterium]|nr:hypothetical protein [Bacillota bacterium]